MGMARGEGDLAMGFEIEESIAVKHPSFKLNATIHPKFVKTIDGIKLVKLDCYQSRGIAHIVTCMIDGLTKDTRRNVCGSKLVRAVLDDIRAARDNAFRSAVVAAPTGSLDFKGCVVPKTKKLRATAMAQPETMPVDMPAIEGVTEACTMRVLHEPSRCNRFSELWVELGASTFEYIAKRMSHAYAEHGASDMEGPGDEVEQS